MSDYDSRFFFQAYDGIRDAHEGLEFRRVLFRSRRGCLRVLHPYAKPGPHPALRASFSCFAGEGLKIDAAGAGSRPRIVRQARRTRRRATSLPRRLAWRHGPRSEERRVGKEGVSTGRTRWTLDPLNTKTRIHTRMILLTRHCHMTL